MKITKIKIKKFRQLENIEENEIGLVNELYGSNGCGKTSFLAFITWMIYGETLDFGKNDDMNIDTYKPNELIGGEITLTKDDQQVVLGREYGYNEKNNLVHKFFVNGRKVKNQGEYYEKVNECFEINEKLSRLKIKGFNLQRALIDPYYLPNNEYQFREFISNILNIDTYLILFGSSDKYTSIKEDYRNQDENYDNCKDFYNQQLRAIEKDLLVHNALIEECKKTKFNQSEYDELCEQLKNLNNYKYEDNIELFKKIGELNKISEQLIQSREQDEINKPISKAKQELIELKDIYNSKCEDYNNIFFKNKTNMGFIKVIEDEIKELKELLEKTKASTFEEIRCPNCQSLVNEVEFKEFNKNKVEKIKSLREKIDLAYNKLSMYKIVDLKDQENELKELLNKIKGLQETISNETIDYSSEETKRLETMMETLRNEVQELNNLDMERKNQIAQENTQKSIEIRNKLAEMEIQKSKIDNLSHYEKNRDTLLYNKSVYELRLSLLNEFRLDEIKLIKEKTSQIFGNDFEFEMLVKNKTTDNYKKVCYASIDGLEHIKSNTAKYLKYSIMLLERLKEYIGGCDLPIIFDIADNIGKSTRNEIFNLIKNSQVFYTRISDEDNVERKLNIIK